MRAHGLWWIATLLLTLLLCLPALGAKRDVRGAKLEYSGNLKRMIYHNSTCRRFNCKNCIVRLSSPAEAIKKGYKACKVCGG